MDVLSRVRTLTNAVISRVLRTFQIRRRVGEGGEGGVGKGKETEGEGKEKSSRNVFISPRRSPPREVLRTHKMAENGRPPGFRRSYPSLPLFHPDTRTKRTTDRCALLKPLKVCKHEGATTGRTRGEGI